MLNKDGIDFDSLLAQISERTEIDYMKVIGFSQSNTLVAYWVGSEGEFFAVSKDGNNIETLRRADYSLRLLYKDFDPVVGEPHIDELLATPQDSNLVVVQFYTQPLEEYRRALIDAGAVLHHYLSQYSYIISADSQSKDAIANLPFVRWVGDFHPAYKLEPFIRKKVLSDPRSNSNRRYSIMTVTPGPTLKGRVADYIERIGGLVNKHVPNGFLLEATISPDQLVAVARRDEVLFIDHWEPPTEYIDNVRSVGGANYLQSIAGYDGAGVSLEVMDGNLRETHQAFQSTPIIFHGPRDGSSSHGTSVFGIIFGNGAGNASGRGLLRFARGIFADNGFLVDRYQHTSELLAPPYNAVLQSNSWGACCFYAYTTAAADIDHILFNNDIVLLQAQANEGSIDSDVIAFAKNLVSVGAVRHFNTLDITDDVWSNAGSIGPAPDGRIKPDLSFWFDSITTTSNLSDISYTTDFGGTSAATPITAGFFGLFFQMWNDGIFGNPVVPSPFAFDNRPNMSTSKAMMINTCTPYPFVGNTADLTRSHQGWGRPDVQRLYDLHNRIFVVDESDTIQNLETHSYQLNVAEDQPEFRATLVYTDLPGVPVSSQHRINDLTLRVVSPNRTIYWGNNGMMEGNVTPPGGSHDSINTVENVWINNPMPGQWTVQVIGTEIVADAHLETNEVDADYALVVSGVSPVLLDGDLNCDEYVNGLDVAAFVLALTDLGSYELAYPFCDSRRGDFNGSGNLDLADIDDFVAVLIGNL